MDTETEFTIALEDAYADLDVSYRWEAACHDAIAWHNRECRGVACLDCRLLSADAEDAANTVGRALLELSRVEEAARNAGGRVG